MVWIHPVVLMDLARRDPCTSGSYRRVAGRLMVHRSPRSAARHRGHV